VDKSFVREVEAGYGGGVVVTRCKLWVEWVGEGRVCVWRCCVWRWGLGGVKAERVMAVWY